MKKNFFCVIQKIPKKLKLIKNFINEKECDNIKMTQIQKPNNCCPQKIMKSSNNGISVTSRRTKQNAALSHGYLGQEMGGGKRKTNRQRVNRQSERILGIYWDF